ncbi:MAG: cysteine desulfurase [Candidatus Symbiobacter sp.]|nr:cysteine desulfurase [Candidatus Symbiobacter sp.]
MDHLPSPLASDAKSPLDGAILKKQFPIFANDAAKNPTKPLVYLDSGASTQKPATVIAAIRDFYENYYANIHRGVYRFSQRASDAVEQSRVAVQKLINAPSADNIVFTSGTTEGLNLLAATLPYSPLLKKGDRVVISELEHHANIVPWQMMRDRHRIDLAVAPIDRNPDSDNYGGIDRDALAKLLQKPTRLLAITHSANATGASVPVAEIIAAAHRHGILVAIDGAQAVAHQRVDVQALDCDFYVFSGHKIYGPTGVGVLYGRGEYLAALPPYQTGGDMIEVVSFEKTSFQPPPQRFEAGTPDIAAIIGIKAAIEFLQAVGLARIAAHEHGLVAYALAELAAIPEITIMPAGRKRDGVVSFTLGKIHPHDLGTILDDDNIAIRAGHHCAQPLLRCLGVAATARASFGVYNEFSDIDRLCASLRRAQAMWG